MITTWYLIFYMDLFYNRMLLKRGPYGGIPFVKRVLIVAPSSLIGNWENEFVRWLGRGRLRLFSVDQVSLCEFLSITF